MKNIRNKAIILLLLSASLSMGSCKLFSPQDDPTLYYVLASLDDEGSTMKLTSKSGFVISVGPTSVATYLDRHQVVTRKSNNELDVSEFHVWGESLDEGVSRVIARNLAQLLDTPAVAPYPEVDLVEYDYRVGLLINKFEATAAGPVVLDCAWGIVGSPGSDIEATNYFFKTSVVRKIEESVAEGKAKAIPSREATAVAMSEAVNQLSVEIAKALLKRGKPKGNAD